MNWIIYGLGSLLWAIPILHSASGSMQTAHNFARLVQVGVLLLLSLLWLAPRLTQGNTAQPMLSSRWLPFYGVALAALVAFSTWHSAVPAVAARELVLFAALWCMACVVSSSVRDEVTLARTLRIMVVGGLMYAALVVTLLAATLVTGTLAEPWTALIGFDNPRFLNHAQTVALPLVAAVSAGDEARRWRRVAWFTLVLSGMLLFITYGRATLLALLVGLLAGWWTFGGRGRLYVSRTVIPTLLGMGLMWTCYLLWMRPAGFHIDTDQLVHPHYRDYLISESIKLWKLSPWLGAGPMHFAHWYNGEAAHPHDIYFQLLAEYGAPAAVLMTLGAFAWLARAHKALRGVVDRQVPMAMGLWGALLGIAVDGALSGNFVMPIPQLWIAMVIGLSLAFFRMTGALTATHPAPVLRYQAVSRWAIRLLVAAACLWLVLKAVEESNNTTYPTIDTPGAVGNPHGRSPLPNPRFWSNGWF